MDIIFTPTHLRIAFAIGVFFGGCIGIVIGVLHEWMHPSPYKYKEWRKGP